MQAIHDVIHINEHSTHLPPKLHPLTDAQDASAQADKLIRTDLARWDGREGRVPQISGTVRHRPAGSLDVYDIESFL